jgi:hypothetical protein
MPPVRAAAGENARMKTIMNRRRLLGGAVALVGTGMAGAAGASFPASSSGNFRAASSVLKDYGIAVSGDDSVSDQIFMEIRPLAETQYTQTILTRTDTGAIIPCIKTSHLETEGGPVTSFEHFHGEIIPCVRTRIDGHALATHELLDADEGGIVPCVRTTAEMLDGGHIGAVEFEHLHPTDDGLIIPCVRTTIDADHALATLELLGARDATPPDPISPALRMTAEMLKGGVLGNVEVAIAEPGMGFAVQVGDRRYVLQDGQLVEETTPPR